MRQPFWQQRQQRLTELDSRTMGEIGKDDVFQLAELVFDGVVDFADDFILATTRNKKQAQAAADEVEEKAGEIGMHALRREGYQEGDWILLDFGDVIVHIFTDEERRRYDFDTLWKEAPVEEYHETGDENE